MSNQNRQWQPIPEGDWELAALHETVMAFERNGNPAAITPFLTAIACLEEIVGKTLPKDSEGWARLDSLSERVRDVVEGRRCGS